MNSLPLRFADEFHLAGDPQTLLVDFWSFLNAVQSTLDWGATDDLLWDRLDELERELEPGLAGQDVAWDFLVSVSDRWRSAPDGIRKAAGGMLAEALAKNGE